VGWLVMTRAALESIFKERKAEGIGNMAHRVEPPTSPRQIEARSMESGHSITLFTKLAIPRSKALHSCGYECERQSSR
jgi:hypothetical protein